MLEYHRADFTIEDENSGLYYLRHFPIDGIEMHPVVIYENDVALMFSRKTVSNELIDRINKVIKENKNPFDKILQSYLVN